MNLLDYVGQMPDPNMVAQGFGQGNTPVAQGPRSWFERMQEKWMPAPEGMRAAGLLTDDDIKNARSQGLLGFGLSLLSQSGSAPVGQAPRLGQALATAVQGANQGYQGTLDRAMGMRVGALGHRKNQLEVAAGERGLERDTAIQKGREEIFRRMPPPKDQAGLAEWIDRVSPYLMQIGDMDTLARFAQMRPGLGRRTGEKAFTEVDRGDVIELRDPVTGRVLETIKKGAAPRDTGAGAEQRAALQMQRDFQREQQLGDDYNKDTTDYRKTAVKINDALKEAPRAMSGDPAAQVNMLYAFVNTMDPASVVREGEIALAQAATPFWQRARALLDKYTSGESVAVPEGMVRSMAQLMERRYGGLNRAVTERQKYYQNRGGRWGISPDTFAGLEPLQGMQPSSPAANVDTLFPKR